MGVMRPPTVLAGLALLLALASAVTMVPLWIPHALLAVAVLMMQGVLRL